VESGKFGVYRAYKGKIGVFEALPYKKIQDGNFENFFLLQPLNRH